MSEKSTLRVECKEQHAKHYFPPIESALSLLVDAFADDLNRREDSEGADAADLAYLVASAYIQQYRRNEVQLHSAPLPIAAEGEYYVGSSRTLSDGKTIFAGEVEDLETGQMLVGVITPAGDIDTCIFRDYLGVRYTSGEYVQRIEVLADVVADYFREYGPTVTDALRSLVSSVADGAREDIARYGL